MADEEKNIRPDIVISNFLTYNESILEEMKSQSPELGKSVANVINALFTKYTKIEEPEKTSPAKGGFSYKLQWSEGLPDDNIVVDNIDELGSLITDAGKTKDPKTSYVKNSILISEPGGNWEFQQRIDVSESGNDWDPEKQTFRDYLYEFWPSEYIAILTDEGVRVQDAESIVGEYVYQTSKKQLQKLDKLLYADTTRDSYVYAFDNTSNIVKISSGNLTRLIEGKTANAEIWSSGSYSHPVTLQLQSTIKTKQKSLAKSGYSTVFPADYPLPAKNIDDRPSPTQSASNYYKDLQLHTTLDTEKLRGIKGSDAEFVVIGNDGQWYTISLTKNGTARWVKAGSEFIVPLNVEENIEKAIQKFSKGISKMNSRELYALLEEKKEAMTIFEKSEPEYVELELEMDDIEEEIEKRN